MIVDDCTEAVSQTVSQTVIREAFNMTIWKQHENKIETTWKHENNMKTTRKQYKNNMEKYGTNMGTI